MNYSQYGWYYKNGFDKSPSWSGVEFLYKFLINNKGAGPVGEEVFDVKKLEPGDVIQLSFISNIFGHSLFVLNQADNLDDIRVATHTIDSYNRPLSSYVYQRLRMVHIAKIN